MAASTWFLLGSVVLLVTLPVLCEATDCGALARTGIFATGTISPNCCNQTLYSKLFDCDDNQRIVQLMLNNNAMSGALPLSLGELTWLMGLDLSGNFLTGRLTALTNLTRLTFLRISANNFGGPLDALVRAACIFCSSKRDFRVCMCVCVCMCMCMCVFVGLFLCS
jgi:hypothetical protein